MLKVTAKKSRIRIHNPMYGTKDPDPYQTSRVGTLLEGNSYYSTYLLLEAVLAEACSTVGSCLGYLL